MEGPVLLIGVGGMLYRAWAELLTARQVRFDAPPIAELDLTDAASLARGVRPDYRLVVNCAAWTDVDRAESQRAEALRINGTGVGELARRCATVGATLVHYSTDYVFSGRASSPYPVDAPREPLNAYGESKAAGEIQLEASGCEHLLIRTSWLYAPWAKNFVRTIARLSRERERLSVVRDQRGRPTSSEHLARTSLALLDKGARGAYHVSDGGECSWWEFAGEIVRLCGASCRVEPCSSAEYSQTAKRPTYSVLDLSRTESLVGPMPDWRVNLAEVMRRLES
jgi:dTDP-4-dehydrorhamnose reductase